MKRASPKVVHLADLQRYIFTTEYNPQVSPGGKHELSFNKASGTYQPLSSPPCCLYLALTRADATDFMEAIDDLFE
jgi:hypothetical protein